VDDIQDGSTQRRGRPVAHDVFGVAQTINSANYIYFKAQMNLYRLADPNEAVRVFTEELLSLHRGQGLELWWRDSFVLPDEAAYFNMVSGKTGGLLRLVVRLLKSQSSFKEDIIPLIDIVGLIFQILDDYKSLLDGKVSNSQA
jgi:geranylgeranyl pyrophosphate synthase